MIIQQLSQYLYQFSKLLFNRKLLSVTEYTRMFFAKKFYCRENIQFSSLRLFFWSILPMTRTLSPDTSDKPPHRNFYLNHGFFCISVLLYVQSFFAPL